MSGRMTAYRVLGPGDPLHGTPGGYTNHRCRCPECRTVAIAGAARRQQRPCTKCGRPCWSGTKSNKVKRTGLCRACEGLSRRKNEHGTETMYNKGCHCRPCRDASAKGRRERRHRAAARV